MDSLTVEMIEKLHKQKANLEDQLEQLKGKTVQTLWTEDIDRLQVKMVGFETDWDKKFGTGKGKVSKIAIKKKA